MGVDSWDLLKKTFIQRYSPPSKTAKQLEEIRNFKQEGDETLYQAWERYNDLLYKCPTHDINNHHKWHDGSSSRKIESSSNSEGITAIVNKLENLGRDMKKLKENVHAIQVGCQICGGAHLDKDCPLNEEVKSVEEVKYGEFGRPFPNNNRNDGRFNKGGYDQPASVERRPSLTEIINKYMEEASKRHAEQDEWLKKFYQSAPLFSRIIYPLRNKDPRSVNVIPKSMFEHLKLAQLKKTDMLVEMADMTKRSPIGIVENVLVKIDKFLFPSDFVVTDMLNTRYETMILGRPFIATIHAKIDVFNKEISLGNGDKSSRFEKSDNNYDNHIQERISKKTRMLKSNTNLPSTHFCKPVKQICNGILKVWPTCDLTLKACNGGIEVYGMNEEGNIKRWYEEWCNENSIVDTPTSKLVAVQEDYKPRPNDYYFKDWLLTKVGHTEVSEPVKKALLKTWLLDCFQEELVKDPRSRSFDDYKRMFNLEVDQLVDECELGIGKYKGIIPIGGMIKNQNRRKGDNLEST
ncbi:phospholipase-like protein [Tanacetum coccineum]|uniref:Phospholipase-like protein n=1 Tax=Tanacetum coccineum TaxID=301880 RepID=A0ABQ4ZY85_9ASTR